VSFERDDSLDLSGARPVRLGGREWVVAPLSLRQILAIADFVPKLSTIGADSLSGERLVPLAEVEMMRPAVAALELSRSKLAAWASMGFAGFVVFGWIVEATIKLTVSWAWSHFQ
jgi:hypothetical protein